jgi:Tol biopolymer transport system component
MRMKKHVTLAACIVLAGLFLSCSSKSSNVEEKKTVPHQSTWGIYVLDLTTQNVTLVYGSQSGIFPSALRLDAIGQRLLFAEKIDGLADTNYEICTIRTNGSDFQRLTNNSYQDIYAAWSSNESEIIFLSWRADDFDLYLMNADGSDQRLFYDSGSHDADVDWQHNTIVFTSGSSIWSINSDGSGAQQLTDPPRAGEWGNANLPFGDYDPKLSLDGQHIVFERLVDDISSHGNYDIFKISVDGTLEGRLTNSGYSQGLPSWNSFGNRIVYTVAAIEDQGVYDLYVMNSDGSDNHNITPSYFPATFLCHAGTLEAADVSVYFIGQWYE